MTNSFPERSYKSRSIRPAFIAFGLLLMFSFSVAAQKLVVERGEKLVRIEKSMSEDQAIKQAREMAMVDAIEKAFGAVVVQGNSTFLENTSSGSKAETNARFNMLMNTFVNGEWVETLDESYEVINHEDGYRWVKFSIKGKIRELPKYSVQFLSQSLSCPEEKCKTTIYNSGQDFYLHFKSAQAGFLTVFADYNGETFRILPYQKSSLNNLPVKADQEYVFFDKQKDVTGEGKAVTDRINLVAEQPQEDYKLFVIFSEEDFSKPMLDDKNKQLLSADLQKAGYRLPKSLKSEEFQKWLNSVRAKNPGVQLDILPVVVRK